MSVKSLQGCRVTSDKGTSYVECTYHRHICEANFLGWWLSSWQLQQQT